MAQIPDGLVFEYVSEGDGVTITCIQSELIKCKNCLNLCDIPAEEKEKHYLARYRCALTGGIVDKDDFCSKADKISD